MSRKFKSLSKMGARKGVTLIDLKKIMAGGFPGNQKNRGYATGRGGGDVTRRDAEVNSTLLSLDVAGAVFWE